MCNWESFKEHGTRKIFKEVMAKDFLNFIKITNPQILEAQQNPSINNKKKIIPRHIRVK